MPKKASTLSRSRDRYCVLLTPRERRKLDAASDSDGLQLSEWIRQVGSLAHEYAKRPGRRMGFLAWARLQLELKESEGR